MSKELIDDKSALIEQVYSRVPYSHNIKALDTTSEPNAIRFEWHGSRYRVSVGGHTETIGDGVLIGDDKSILMQTLIQGYLP